MLLQENPEAGAGEARESLRAVREVRVGEEVTISYRCRLLQNITGFVLNMTKILNMTVFVLDMT